MYIYIYGTCFHLKFAPQNKPETMCIKHNKSQKETKRGIGGGVPHIHIYMPLDPEITGLSRGDSAYLAVR